MDHWLCVMWASGGRGFSWGPLSFKHLLQGRWAEPQACCIPSCPAMTLAGLHPSPLESELRLAAEPVGPGDIPNTSTPALDSWSSVGFLMLLTSREDSHTVRCWTTFPASRVNYQVNSSIAVGRETEGPSQQSHEDISVPRVYHSVRKRKRNVSL